MFKSTSRRDRETSLFLFVTPTIMHGDSSFDVLDIESCKRKQKADELIGYTEIYNAKFVGCEQQDSASGVYRGDGCRGATYDTVRPGIQRAPRVTPGGGYDAYRADPSGFPQQPSGVDPSTLKPGDVVPPGYVDPATLPSGQQPGAVPPAQDGGLPPPQVGAGSASDRLKQIGLLEATRFHGIDPQRIRAERNARRAALRAPTVRRATRRASERTGGGAANAQLPVRRPVRFQVGPNNRAVEGTGGFMGSASEPRRTANPPGTPATSLVTPRGFWKTGGT